MTPSDRSKVSTKLWFIDAQVKFVCGDAAKIVPSIHIDYRIDKFDFVFLNRISRSEPSHVPAVRLLEGGGSQVKYSVHFSSHLLS